MKKVIVAFVALIMTAAVLAGGLFAARKLYGMYCNVWDELDYISAAADKIHALDLEKLATEAVLVARVDTLAEQVEYLHRQAMIKADTEGTQYNYDWVNSAAPYIAHACGGIDGNTYTNSREAFIYNYEQGQRVFEIDFNLSSDGALIAAHDEDTWKSKAGTDLPYTLENFDQLPLMGKYESLNAGEVVELLAAYPDAYVVTDTKGNAKIETMLAFSQLVYCAKNTHPEVLDRIIPQIYNEEMLRWVNAVHPFRSVIFTLYQIPWTSEEILDFCMESGVRFITIPRDLVLQEVIDIWDTLGIQVGVHTINDPEEAKRLLDMGVDMIYTDFILPQQGA